MASLSFSSVICAIGLRVLHGDRDLLGDLAEQLDFLRAERVLAASAQIQRPEHAVVGQERDRAKGPHSFVNPVLGALGFRGQAFQVLLVKHRRLAGGDGDTGGRLAVGLGNSFFDERLVFRKTQHVDAVAASLLVEQDQRGAIVLDDFPQAGADRREKIVQAQMGDDRVVHVEQKPHAVPFVGQLPLGGLALSSCSTLSTASATCLATCCMKRSSAS